MSINITEDVGKLKALRYMAEEGSELTKASLKLLRLYEEPNMPGNISALAGIQNLTEEMADVMNLISVLMKLFDIPDIKIADIMAFKMERWEERIELSKTKAKKAPEDSQTINHDD